MPWKVCCGMTHFELTNDVVKELVFWKCSYRGSLSHELLLYSFCESSYIKFPKLLVFSFAIQMAYKKKSCT